MELGEVQHLYKCISKYGYRVKDKAWQMFTRILTAWIYSQGHRITTGLENK